MPSPTKRIKLSYTLSNVAGVQRELEMLLPRVECLFLLIRMQEAGGTAKKREETAMHTCTSDSDEVHVRSLFIKFVTLKWEKV